MMGELAVLAEAFRYPKPGRLALLQHQTAALAPGPARTQLEGFIQRVTGFSLGQWEELCTRTLELNPTAPPYVGYVIWGENYARGRFMAVLNHAMREEGVDLDGELPDHLVPVLRYVDRVSTPIAELSDVLEPALRSIHDALAKADPDNPYLGLLAAALESVPAYLEETHACQ
jgi:nitrate reductase delta subunit